MKSKHLGAIRNTYSQMRITTGEDDRGKYLILSSNDFFAEHHFVVTTPKQIDKLIGMLQEGKKYMEEKKL